MTGGARRVKVNLAAYADAVMHTECPHCGAPPNEWCTRADGHTRRTPCIARFRPQAGVAEFEGRGAVPSLRHQERHHTMTSRRRPD